MTYGGDGKGSENLTLPIYVILCSLVLILIFQDGNGLRLLKSIGDRDLYSQQDLLPLNQELVNTITTGVVWEETQAGEWLSSIS